MNKECYNFLNETKFRIEVREVSSCYDRSDKQHLTSESVTILEGMKNNGTPKRHLYIIMLLYHHLSLSHIIMDNPTKYLVKKKLPVRIYLTSFSRTSKNTEYIII